VHAPPPDFLSHSHGEGFLRFFEVRCSRQGIYIFDEPESALSPSRQIEFLKLLRQHRPALAHPTSRGQVRLASANWRDAPVIEPNYLATDHDLDAVVKAIEVARSLAVNPPLIGYATRKSFQARRRSAGRI